MFTRESVRNALRTLLGFWLVVALAFALIGCQTCEPLCSECPPIIERVESAPEIIERLPPAVVVPESPQLESVERFELAATDPASWLRLVARDLILVLDMFYQAQSELAAVNASRGDAE